MRYYCSELWENVRALLHVIITGCSNCQAGTLVWLGVAIREQWWIGWMLTDVMAGVIVKWDLRFKTKQIRLKLHLLLGCVKLKVILPPIFLKNDLKTGRAHSWGGVLEFWASSAPFTAQLCCFGGEKWSLEQTHELVPTGKYCSLATSLHWDSSQIGKRSRNANFQKVL